MPVPKQRRPTTRVQQNVHKPRAAGSAPRRAWLDVRLIVGIGLVVASVVGVYSVVAAAEHSTSVYTSKVALSVGEPIRTSDLVLTQVRLGNATGLYLVVDGLPSDGLVATRPVASGELIPVSAVGTSSGVTETSVVVDLNVRLAESIREGSSVDVWVAREVERGRFGPPTVLIASATVVRISEKDGLMARTAGLAVEILIPKAKVATALESIANSDAISLVAVNRSMDQ